MWINANDVKPGDRLTVPFGIQRDGKTTTTVTQVTLYKCGLVEIKASVNRWRCEHNEQVWKDMPGEEASCTP